MAKNMLSSKPAYSILYGIYLDAFYKLNSERQVSEGHYGSIPVSKIIDYAHWMDINEDESFVDTIVQVDNSYVNYVSNQLRAQLKQASRG